MTSVVVVVCGFCFIDDDDDDDDDDELMIAIHCPKHCQSTCINTMCKLQWAFHLRLKVKNFMYFRKSCTAHQPLYM